jgi:coproporphyrinogen III oxidase-like Fe-S oxidoreductase
VLEKCGRSHRVKDVHEAIALMHAAAPKSWSLDLISGLPEVTVDVWKDTLQAAIDSDPPHMSIYDLQVASSFLSHTAVVHQKKSNVNNSDL